jgi:methylated-DNA-[protein]-cysteine S-methyltransferase
MEKINFSNRVYELCKQIPKGKVTTYKNIANKLGTRGYQAIGQVLRCNPNAPKVPCHRVISSNGSLGGYKGSKNNLEKVNLLKGEGVIISNNKIDLKKFQYEF